MSGRNHRRSTPPRNRNSDTPTTRRTSPRLAAASRRQAQQHQQPPSRNQNSNNEAEQAIVRARNLFPDGIAVARRIQDDDLDDDDSDPEGGVGIRVVREEAEHEDGYNPNGGQERTRQENPGQTSQPSRPRGNDNTIQPPNRRATAASGRGGRTGGGRTGGARGGRGRGRGGRGQATGPPRRLARSRGPAFRRTEIETMLDFIDEVLPIGGDEWEEVANLHLERFPEMERNSLSLRRKFTELYKTSMPTGTAVIPDEVRRAKEIFARIEDRADTASQVLDEDLGIEDDDDNGAGDDGAAVIGTAATARNNGNGNPPPAIRQPRPMIQTRNRVNHNQQQTNLDNVFNLVGTQMLERLSRPPAQQQGDDNNGASIRAMQQQTSMMMSMMMMRMMAQMMGMPIMVPDPSPTVPLVPGVLEHNNTMPGLQPRQPPPHQAMVMQPTPQQEALHYHYDQQLVPPSAAATVTQHTNNDEDDDDDDDGVFVNRDSTHMTAGPKTTGEEDEEE